MGWSLYLIFIIALILLLVSAILISIAAGEINKNKERKNDPNLSAAYNYLVAGSIISWISVAIGITLFVIILVQIANNNKTMEKYDQRDKHALILGLMVACFALAAINGVLAAIAASKMLMSENFSTKSESDKRAYNLAVASAILGFGVVVVILTIILVYYGTKKTCKVE